jgi:hypothetical protein
MGPYFGGPAPGQANKECFCFKGGVGFGRAPFLLCPISDRWPVNISNARDRAPVGQADTALSRRNKTRNMSQATALVARHILCNHRSRRRRSLTFARPPDDRNEGKSASIEGLVLPSTKYGREPNPFQASNAGNNRRKISTRDRIGCSYTSLRSGHPLCYARGGGRHEAASRRASAYRAWR